MINVNKSDYLLNCFTKNFAKINLLIGHIFNKKLRIRENMIIRTIKMALLLVLIFPSLSILSMDAMDWDDENEPRTPESYLVDFQNILDEEALNEALNQRAQELKLAGKRWHEALCKAIKAKNVYLVSNLLLDNEYQRSFAITNIIYEVDENGDSPIKLAIKMESLEVLECLMSLGGIELKGDYGRGILNFAHAFDFSSEELKEQIIKLLKNGIPLEKKFKRTYLETQHLQLKAMRKELLKIGLNV